MRTKLAAVLVLALIALPSAGAADRAVTVAATGFSPKDVTVAAGDTVTWRNTDTRSHQVSFDKTPCNLTLAPAASGTCRFLAGGKLNYRDATQPGGNFRGSVTVTGAKSSVTLSSPRKVARYLAPVALSGVVSSQQAGESVTISAQECGKTTFTQLGTVQTTTGGNWTYIVKPGSKTDYRARWRTTDSTATVLNVMPKLALSRVRSRFTVRLSAATGFQGKLVLFQRYQAATRRWVTLKSVKLGAARPPAAGTVVTPASFRSRVRRGWRLRAFLPQAQAGACYAAAPSNTLRVR
jgi:plastocyanin